METDTQVFSRMFKDCQRSDGSKILQKIIRFNPVVKFKDFAVSLKYGGADGKMGSVAWITPEILTDFECNPDEDFDKKWDDGKSDDSSPQETDEK